MIQSGSNTTDARFVSYRAIFEPRKSGDKFDDRMEEFGITKDIWEAADKIVSSFREFGRFIAVMGRKIPMEELEERHHLWPGSWVSVKSFQEKIVSPEIKEHKGRKRSKAQSSRRSYLQFLKGNHLCRWRTGLFSTPNSQRKGDGISGL